MNLKKRAQVSSDGLCRDSIIRTLGLEYPGLDDLCDLVENGAILEPGEGFVPNNVPEQSRELERKLGKQTLKQYVKLWRESKKIIVDPRVLSTQEYQKLHWIANHWTMKKKDDGTIDPDGRILIDPSNAPDGVIPLNNEVQKENAIKRYKQLVIPQLHEMIQAIIAYCEMYGLKITDIRIAKSDIQGAYTKFCWSVKSCYLMCVRIEKDLCYLPVNGNFGTSAGPFIFDCLARPLHDCIENAFILKEDILKSPFQGETESFSRCSSYSLCAGTQMGRLFRLTDDFIEMTRADCSDQCHEIVMQKCDSYFGEGNGWNPKKNRPPSRYEVVGGIGLDFTAEPGWLFLPKKHWNRLLKEIFLFDTDKSHTIKEYQVLGSILERASIMIYGLAPYLVGVYRMLARMGADMTTKVPSDHKLSKVKKSPDNLCRMCVHMVRVLTLWMFCDPALASVPMSSALSQKEIPSSIKCFFDAGTNCPEHGQHCGCALRENRIGALIQDVEGMVIAYTSLVVGLTVDYPDMFQVHREFLGKLVVLVLLSKLEVCVRGTIVTLVGDNTAALTWADSGRVNSRVCVNMNIAACFLVQHTGIVEAKSIQLRSDQMGVTDVLSRGNPLLMNEYSDPPLTVTMRSSLNDASIGYIDLNSDSVMSDLLLLVVPPKASIVSDLSIDSRLENPIDSIIKILGIIRKIPRKGKWLPHQLPLSDRGGL